MTPSPSGQNNQQLAQQQAQQNQQGRYRSNMGAPGSGMAPSAGGIPSGGPPSATPPMSSQQRMPAPWSPGGHGMPMRPSGHAPVGAQPVGPVQGGPVSAPLKPIGPEQGIPPSGIAPAQPGMQQNAQEAAQMQQQRMPAPYTPPAGSQATFPGQPTPSAAPTGSAPSPGGTIPGTGQRAAMSGPQAPGNPRQIAQQNQNRGASQF